MHDLDTRTEHTLRQHEVCKVTLIGVCNGLRRDANVQHVSTGIRDYIR